MFKTIRTNYQNTISIDLDFLNAWHKIRDTLVVKDMNTDKTLGIISYHEFMQKYKHRSTKMAT